MAVDDEFVRIVRRSSDGGYSVSDRMLLKEDFQSVLPTVGDFLSEIGEDGWINVFEVIARHRVREEHDRQSYWAVICRDTRETAETRAFADCMVAMSEEEREASARRAERDHQAMLTRTKTEKAAKKAPARK